MTDVVNEVTDARIKYPVHFLPCDTHAERTEALVTASLRTNTSTTTGLRVQAALDSNSHELGITVTDEDLKRLKLTPAKFHWKWNYIIKPRYQTCSGQFFANP